MIKNHPDMRWIIFDFKRDELLNSIGAAEIPIGVIPREPGIYICHPMPYDDEAVIDYLWAIWSDKNIGLFIDEGYMIGDSPALRAILTQGRSKRLPVIMLAQRPVRMSRFILSEADFIQVYQLTIKDDRKTVQNYLSFELEDRLPDYCSYFYDVAKNKVVILSPAPDRDMIIGKFFITQEKKPLPKLRAV
jgi:hypothetical protein